MRRVLALYFFLLGTTVYAVSQYVFCKDGHNISKPRELPSVGQHLTDHTKVEVLHAVGDDKRALCGWYRYQPDTNTAPDDPNVRSLSSRGMYYFGLDGTGTPQDTWFWEIFDPRLHTRWLCDDELERIYMNGMEEINRRGIPRWEEVQ